MSLYDEQIRRRMKNDRETMEDSFFRMASVVMDKWGIKKTEDELLISKGAIDDILKYYRRKSAQIPDDVRDIKKQIEYAFRPAGLMARDVELKDGWQKDAYGPMLGMLKDSNTLVALMPAAFGGYRYTDPDTGNKIRISKKNAATISSDALCFYRPLPSKKLGIPDLLLYMKESIAYRDVILIIISILAATLIGMLEPRIYSLVTGVVLRSRRMSLLIGIMVFLLASVFASQMITVIKNLLMERLNTKTSQAVQASVMMRVLSLPASFFRGFSSGELASRTSAVSSLCSMILNNVIVTGITGLMSLLYITQIAQFAPVLVVPSVIVTAATVTVSVAVSLLQIRITREKMKLTAKEKGISYEILGGIQKIRLSGSEKRVFSRWAKHYSGIAKLEYDPPAFLKLNGVILLAISLAGTAVMYFLAVKSGISESHYYAFSAAYGRLAGAFSAISGIAVSVAEIKPVLEMAEPILKAEPETASDKKEVSSLSGHVEMNHVSFRYEENTPYIMKDLSLQVNAGEYVAIVGRTGCGKSTIVRLLLGFEKPEQGTVFFDQYDLNCVDPRSVRKNIGVVTQSGQLFQGDIYSNITIAAPDMTIDEAWEAAEIAGIADDIRKMPMGMHTIISEGAGGVSGGQKQRLMIARAVAPKPKILIFDEATSALDNKTQKQISDALDKMNCTRIVIAHRLSTIRHCDRRLMLEDGRIIEEGTYDELIEKNGSFADMVSRQRI